MQKGIPNERGLILHAPKSGNSKLFCGGEMCEATHLVAITHLVHPKQSLTKANQSSLINSCSPTNSQCYSQQDMHGPQETVLAQ